MFESGCCDYQPIRILTTIESGFDFADGGSDEFNGSLHFGGCLSLPRNMHR